MKLAALPLILAGCLGPSLPLGTRAQDCGGCHADQHAAWSSSPHANSARSPVFEAMLGPVEKAWGSAARARCVACHSPGYGGDEAIGCVTCHAAVGNRQEGNGALVVDLDAPLAGPSSGEGVERPAHRSGPRGFLTSASLCGTCHEVHGPGLLVEPTLTEFRASAFVGDDSCIGCHGGDSSQDHRLAGLDPPWGASPEEAKRAAEASRALLERALKLEVARDASGLFVRLTNVNTGHAVPTGVASLRDLWIDVELTDQEGRQVVVERVLELGARLTREGQDVALPTDATLITPRSLDPGEVREWRSPKGATSLVATLRARAFRSGALSALGLEGRAHEVPVHLVLERTVE